jgi:hypothetical protein
MNYITGSIPQERVYKFRQYDLLIPSLFATALNLRGILSAAASFYKIHSQFPSFILLHNATHIQFNHTVALRDCQYFLLRFATFILIVAYCAYTI